MTPDIASFTKQKDTKSFSIDQGYMPSSQDKGLWLTCHFEDFEAPTQLDLQQRTQSSASRPLGIVKWNSFRLQEKAFDARNVCQKAWTGSDKMSSWPRMLHCIYCWIVKEFNNEELLIHQRYRVFFLTGPPKKWLSVRLHVNPFKKVLSVRIS